MVWVQGDSNRLPRQMTIPVLGCSLYPSAQFSLWQQGEIDVFLVRCRHWCPIAREAAHPYCSPWLGWGVVGRL